MIASVDFAISEMLKIQRAFIYKPFQGFSEYVTFLKVACESAKIL